MPFNWFQPNIEKLTRQGNAGKLTEALWDERFRTDAFIALTTLGERALVPLLKNLNNDATTPFDYLIILAVASAGKPAVAPLVDALRHGTQRARELAAQALGLIGDRCAIEPLWKALEDRGSNLPGCALEALARLGAREIYPELLKSLMVENQHTQLYAVISLGIIRHPASVKSLQLILELYIQPESEDQNQDIGQRFGRRLYNGLILYALMGSLAILGDDGAWKQLIDTLHRGGEANNRVQSAKELGRIGGMRAADHLIKALQYSDQSLKYAVIWALAQTNEPSAIRALENLQVNADDNIKRWIRLALHYFKVFHARPFVSEQVEKETLLPLFIFDSTALSEEAGADYSGYFQSEILHAFSTAVKNHVASSNWSGKVSGCCGDLLEESFLGEVPAITQLRQWLSVGAHGIGLDRLDKSTSSAIGTGKEFSFIPYAVGLSGLTPEITDSMHQSMFSGCKGYKGIISLGGSCPIENLDKELSLPLKLFIEGTHCKGWDVPQKKLKELGFMQSF